MVFNRLVVTQSSGDSSSTVVAQDTGEQALNEEVDLLILPL